MILLWKDLVCPPREAVKVFIKDEELVWLRDLISAKVDILLDIKEATSIEQVEKAIEVLIILILVCVKIVGTRKRR